MIPVKLKICSLCGKEARLWKSNPATCITCSKKSFKPLNKAKQGQKTNFEHKQELNKWFAEQIENMPRYCEESGNYLNPYVPWGARAYVAHIVPKRHFKSVATHPLNRMFYDIDVHTNFDKAASEEIKRMKSYHTIIWRFNQFKHLIAQEEFHHLPDYLLELMD